jgi:hypothetical protein
MSIIGDTGDSPPRSPADIAGDDGDVGNAAPLPRRLLFRRPQGKRFVLFVLASLVGWWLSLDPALDIGLDGQDEALVGTISAHWQFFPVEEATAHPESDIFKRAGVGVKGHIYGYVAYIVDERVSCEPALIEDASHRTLMSMCDHTIEDGVSLSSTIRKWLRDGALHGLTPVRLAARLAIQVVSGRRDVLHVIPLTLRTPRKHMLRYAPSQEQIRRFRNFVDVPRPRQLRHRFALSQYRVSKLIGAVPAEEILEWLEASKNEKQIKLMSSSIVSWAKVLSRTGAETFTQMVQRSRTINVELVRQARVRCDAVAMLAFRHYWKTVNLEDASIVLWSDASPQWRGVELFASSFELVLPGGVQRRKFPFVQATFGFDALSKVLTLLWQIFLQVGPDFSCVRAFCNAIRCMCTDMGVERLMSDQVDCLKEFYWLIDPKLDLTNFPDQTYLFPKCVHYGGWRHLWDNLLRRGLVRLPWFAEWLADFKAVISIGSLLLLMVVFVLLPVVCFIPRCVQCEPNTNMHSINMLSG